MTLGSHQKSVGQSQDHITPKWIIDRTGPYDLDPCASVTQPWLCARINWTSGGLEREWPRELFTYLNPPFDRYQVGEWMARLAEHNNGIALLHARTEAAWFEPFAMSPSAILFMADRIKFCRRTDPSNQRIPAHRPCSSPSAPRRYCGCSAAALPVRWLRMAEPASASWCDCAAL